MIDWKGPKSNTEETQRRHMNMWLLNPDGNTVCVRFKLPRYRFIGCGPNKINFATQKVFEQWWGDVIVWSLRRPSTNWNGEYMDKLFVSANFPKWIHQFLSHKSTKTISAFNTYIESRKMRVETINWSKSQNFTISIIKTSKLSPHQVNERPYIGNRWIVCWKSNNAGLQNDTWIWI